MSCPVPGPLCPLCGHEMKKRRAFPAPTEGEQTWCYACASCGYWMPCSRNGGYPNYVTPIGLGRVLTRDETRAELDTILKDVTIKPTKNRGFDVLGNCLRCCRHVENRGTDMHCPHCDGGEP